jgi:hypothetical protein
MRFLSDDKICIPVNQVIKLDPASLSIGCTLLKYRTQKNGWHGKERQHTGNASIRAPCHVPSCMQIIQLFAELFGHKHYIPLCIYRHDDCTIRYITASVIKYTFCMTAA